MLINTTKYNEYLAENYIISDCNLGLYNQIMGEWSDFCYIIQGPKQGGKTHLASLWAMENQAIFIDNHSQLYDGNIVIDDIDNIDEFDFFNQYNHVKENKYKMLLTCSKLPEFNLKDSNSRLHSSVILSMSIIDDNLMEKLILKEFKCRQLNISADIIQYLMK